MSVTPIRTEVMLQADAHARGYRLGVQVTKAQLADQINEARSQGFEAGRASHSWFANTLAGVAIGLGAAVGIHVLLSIV